MYERITTENPQGNMGNMFNATKIINREVYLRDWNGEGDLNLVDFCKARYKEIWGEDFDKEMDKKVGAEDFGEYMDDGSLLSAFYWITVGYAGLRSRLAAYEDSGLSPEEVKALQQENEQYKTVLKQARAALGQASYTEELIPQWQYKNIVYSAIQAIDELEGSK